MVAEGVHVAVEVFVLVGVKVSVAVSEDVMV
jgi:hypothetical protein